MKIERLNSWLSLIANLGVVVGIIVVAFELQQTQIAMNAEASQWRAEMAIENGRQMIEYDMSRLEEKLQSGESLSEIEETNVRLRWNQQLRYFENLHYQWQLGVLDEEIWQTNLLGISTLYDSLSFKFAYPDWPGGTAASRFRPSFVELVDTVASN